MDIKENIVNKTSQMIEPYPWIKYKFSFEETPLEYGNRKETVTTIKVPTKIYNVCILWII